MDVILYTVLGIILIDALIGWGIYFSGKLGKNMIPIVLAATCSIADEYIAHYFYVRFKNNLAVYYFSNTLEYAFFAWFLHANLSNAIIKKFIIASIVICVSATLAYSLTFIKEAHAEPYTAAMKHNYTVIVKSLLLTIWSICYFKGIFEKISRYQHLDIFVLLIASGMLFYFAFSTVFFAAKNYLITEAIKENPNLLTDVYKIRSAAFSYAYEQLQNITLFLLLTNILLYLCILIALLNKAFTTKKYSVGF